MKLILKPKKAHMSIKAQNAPCMKLLGIPTKTSAPKIIRVE